MRCGGWWSRYGCLRGQWGRVLVSAALARLAPRRSIKPSVVLTLISSSTHIRPLHLQTTLPQRSMSPLLGGKSERAVDDHANELAQFAVSEIAGKANLADLSLVRVSKLSTQVVAGIKYYYELETQDKAGKTHHFEAQVWEKPVRGLSRRWGRYGGGWFW